MTASLRSENPPSIPLPAPAGSRRTRRDKTPPAPLARPPLTLVLGPAGAGKTEWTLQRCLAASQDGSRALLIVSSLPQAQTRAEQIAARLQCAPADVPVSILTFRQLITKLADYSASMANSEDSTDAANASAGASSNDPLSEAGAPDDRDDLEAAMQAAPGNESEQEEAPFRPIGRAFQRMALSELFQSAVQPDDYLGRMRRAPGFVPALAERLREWKLACLTPALLEQFGPTVAAELNDATFTRKTAELARLFHAYEAFLTRNRLRDEEDSLRAAIAGAASGAARLPADISCVLVDGFYRFNPMQRLLLAALAQQSDGNGRPVEVAVTLPYEERRPLLFAAPARTLAVLRQEFHCHAIVLNYSFPARPAALARLGDHLFGDANAAAEEIQEQTQKETINLEAVKGKTADGKRKSGSAAAAGGEGEGDKREGAFAASLALFDAPNPYVEAEMVARQFRRLYDGGGYHWDDFAVILRAMGDYAPILAAVFERHGIPLGVDGPEALTENPFIKTLLALLSTLRRGWQRDDVLAFLKSSYTAPDKLETDSLRRQARKEGVREGKARWLELIEPRGKGEKGGKTAEENASDSSSRIPHSASDENSVAATLRDMAYFDALLTRERRDPREFAAHIEEIVGFFGLDARIAQGEPMRQERDRAAWNAARESLQALAQMAALSNRGRMTFEAFHDELLAAWRTTSSIAAAQGDMVRVAEPYDARERPLKVAAVMGLTERVFPRRITEDPFLRDEERAGLRRHTGLDLEEQKGRADDERFLFYLAVTAPSERLILSYPRSADESDTLPSFYLDEVRALFQHSAPASLVGADVGHSSGVPPAVSSGLVVVSRTLADVAPRLDEAVSEADRLLAACAGLFDPGANPAAEGSADGLRDSLRLMQACLQSEAGGMVAHGVVASRGLPRLPRLQSGDLRRAFAASRTVFSVTELESYGRCPFQYFLRHVLRLSPDADGIHAHTQGTLLHAVLHRYFHRQKQLSIKNKAKQREETGAETGEAQKSGEAADSMDSMNAMRRALGEILAQMLAEENLDAGPHQKRMLHRLLSDALDGFVVREQRFGAQWGLTPAHFELAFGFGQREDWEDEERAIRPGLSGGAAASESGSHSLYDPASCEEPLLLSVTDGGSPVAICGTLDRVDLDATGRRALVLDYKMGKPPEHSAVQKGESLQMPIYLLAVERLFNKVGAVACYDSMRERGRRRFHRSEHVNQRQFMPLLPLEDGTSVTPLNRQQYADLSKTAEATAVRLARSIAGGNIEATPGDHCRACAYNDVCRTSLLGGHDGESLPLMETQ